MKNLLYIFTLIVLAANLSNSHATGQIPDQIIYEGKTYDVIGVQGELPTPNSFGMETRSNLSSNWRGYHTKYDIRLNKLKIYQMTINAKNQEYKKINGISPDHETNKECSVIEGEKHCISLGALYNEVEYPVNFTGKLRLGNTLLSWFRVPMGFQKPSAYKEVIDLEFAHGELVNVINRSEEVEMIRGEFKDYYDKNMTEEAVNKAFSLSMEELK